MKQSLAVLSCLLLAAAGAVRAEALYVYNWSEYLPQEVIDGFEAETGIDVIYTTYDSNEAMYARLKLLDDADAYDVVVPSTYFVSKMRTEGMLQRIDRERITNFRHLAPNLINRNFDPQNDYSIPYLWGSTGIAVNSAFVEPGTVTAWADLWDERFEGALLLHNDVREVFHIALRALGHSGNATEPEKIEAAYEKLKELLPNVRVFNSESPRQTMLAGEVDVGMMWNGEAFMAAEEDAAISYIYPEEGAVLWMDSLVIPANARNPDGAHRFIDYLLRPDISKTISEEIGYASPNIAAVELMDEAVRTNPTVYPPQEALENAEFQVDIGDAVTIYQRYWERLKAAGE